VQATAFVTRIKGGPMDNRKEGKFMAHVHHGHSQVTMMDQVPQNVKDCIKVCLDCSTSCRDTVTHCLQEGGEHAQPDHIWLLLDCAEICESNAHFMMHNSPLHSASCEACGEFCERCAEDCESMGDDQKMQDCAKACHRCAESCKRMVEA
jgi:hypothetical protein